MNVSATFNTSIRRSRDSVCRSCQIRLARQTRSYAAATATATAQPSADSSDTTAFNDEPHASEALQKAYRLSIAPVVSRPPLLTRKPTAFEKAFYLYQKRLNDRLALPPTRHFYYPKGTPADLEWKRKIKARQTAARDIGVYNAYGKEAWQDEVLVGDETSEPENVIEALIRDAEGRTITDAKTVDDPDADGAVIGGDASIGEGMRRRLEVEVDRPSPRVTEADEKNDVKSLNRKLDSALYLLVKNADGRWRFPEDRLLGTESLYQAAERILVRAAGINMNTWIVGNHPIGYYQYDHVTGPRIATVPRYRQRAEHKREEYGEKVFFMKTRIMAGQADLVKNAYGDTDFAWLAKDEIRQRVTMKYWSYICNMLTER